MFAELSTAVIVYYRLSVYSYFPGFPAFGFGLALAAGGLASVGDGVDLSVVPPKRAARSSERV